MEEMRPHGERNQATGVNCPCCQRRHFPESSQLCRKEWRDNGEDIIGYNCVASGHKHAVAVITTLRRALGVARQLLARFL